MIDNKGLRREGSSCAPASDLIQVPANRAVVLQNTACAYCGRQFTPDLRSTKERVIGREPRASVEMEAPLSLVRYGRLGGSLFAPDPHSQQDKQY